MNRGSLSGKLIVLYNDSVEKMRVGFDRAYRKREDGRRQAAIDLIYLRAGIYHYAFSVAT